VSGVSVYVKCKVTRKAHELLKLLAAQRGVALEKLAGTLLEEAVRKEHPKLMSEVERLG